MSAEFSALKESLSHILNPSHLRFNIGLLDHLKLIEGIELSEGEFRKFLDKASEAEVQPLISYILAAYEDSSQQLSEASGAAAETNERKAWVLDKMGLSAFADAITNRMPNQQPMVIVEEEFTKWYTPERAGRTTNYWDAYTSVLTRNGWDAGSIATVGNQATEVLRRLEDPATEHYLSARGLVVGYVQSGKTANFTAVAAKAIDAGYRMIIVLAGTLDILRDQTQRRLDKELMGRESVLSGRDEEDMSDKERKDETYFYNDDEWDRAWTDKGGAFVSHGAAWGTEGFPRIQRITTSTKDYQHHGLNLIHIDCPDKSLPVHDFKNLDNMPCLVAVVKKNASVLKNLNMDLKRAARVNGDLNDLPVLIIDDESDQASINTKDNRKRTEADERERTAVNEQITQLLQNCPRAQYVGYTATPFANVFVDPDDPEDLYPRHFVLMLNEPPAYRGAKWFHDRMDFADNPDDATIETSRSKAFIRDLAEEENYSDVDFVDVRDRELQEALDMFILTGAIKKFREEKHPGLTFRHHTMLVHEGVGTDMHRDARVRLEDMWRKRGYNLGMPIPSLQRLFEEDLLKVMSVENYNASFAVPSSFGELMPYINAAYEEMMTGVDEGGCPILQVDTEGKDSPNFEAGKVWKVLVGGAKLSRGYTVEGLTVSYFRRKAGGADTLMQTGRWFGFRKGYQDLVRLYAPESLVQLFEAAMHDEEVFRDNIKAYRDLDEDDRPALTPMHLAPLVQQSLPDLRPTSRNKMFNAYVKKSAAAPRAVELNTIPENPANLADNFNNVAVPLLQRLKPTPVELAYFRVEGMTVGRPFATAGTLPYYVGTASAQEFIDFLNAMKWHETTAFKENIVNPHIAYLKDLIGRGRHANPEGADFTEVAIILPLKKARSSAKQKFINVPGIPFPVPLVDRSRRKQRHDITGSDRKYTYVIETLASGNSATRPRPEDLEAHRGYLRSNYKLEDLEDPFNMDPAVAKTRGAMLMTLFDDRPKAAQYDAEGNYIEPNFANGEVGFAIAFGSPHAAIHGKHKVVEWGVVVSGPDGKDPVVVDSQEVEKDS